MTGELPSTLHTVIAFTCDLQGKSRMMWSCSGISFENTPFEIVQKEMRECQFGPHYFKKRERTSSRIYLQGTRKLGCHAHIEIREYRLYPEYAFSATENKCLKSKQLRELRESKLHALKQALEEGKPVDVVTKFFVSLPTHESHEKSHPTGMESGPAQKVHPSFQRKLKTWYEKAQLIQTKFREH